MLILKALCKQFFGAKYERVGKSLAACLILFLAVRAAEIRVEIAPFILFLTAMAVSAGVMWQTLHDAGNAERMAGLLMLPFRDGEMTVSLVLAFTCYTLVTKTFLVLVLFFALQEWNALQIVTTLLCAGNGCVTAAAWYVMVSETSRPKKRKQLFSVALWCGGIILSLSLADKIMIFGIMVSCSLLFASWRLLLTGSYIFYNPVSAKQLIRYSRGGGSIFLYLLRYLMTNQSYLWNTVGLCAVAGILPMLLGQFAGLYVMPLGFAILCLNTPLCILLSVDSDLEQAVRTLPGQAARFCIRYTLFLFVVNLAVNSVYLISWQIQLGGVGGREVLTAALIALQSAVLSVLLEWFYPIRNWKIENDLWHHPRKYVVPLVMMLLAGVIGIWSVGIWILFCVVIVEIIDTFILYRGCNLVGKSKEIKIKCSR